MHEVSLPAGDPTNMGHMVWSRIETEHMGALIDGLDAGICHVAARNLGHSNFGVRS
jgi:hypothetical protein